MKSDVLRRKVVLIGDAAVGKSALAQMFQSNGQRFPKQYQMTCGVDLLVKMVAVPEAQTAVELHLFDTSGQDVFDEMLPAYFQDAAAVLLVYDATRPHTFDACHARLAALLSAIGKEGLPGALVSNKMDLRDRICVARPAASYLSEQTGLQYFETSAADGDGVEAPFQHIAAELLKAESLDGY